MGHRANLIIYKNGSYELYYSHWCASTLTTDLFWGWEHALNFIQLQKKVDAKTGWLDDVWGAGGVVMDLDQRVLLFYGGEDLLYDIPLRRVYLQLMKKVWNSWEIRWAYEGMADVADYVGYPRNKVITKKDTSERVISEKVLDPPLQKNWLNSIGSFEFEDQKILIYPLGGSMLDYLSCGPKLINYIDRSLGYSWIDLNRWTPYLPSGGFHVDIPNKVIDCWIAREAAEIEVDIGKRWENWQINWNRDDYEKHIQSTNGNIVFQKTSMEKIINHLKIILLYDFDHQVEAMLQSISTEIGNGQDLETTESALYHVKLDLDKDIREKIIEYAITELKKDVNFQYNEK